MPCRGLCVPDRAAAHRVRQALRLVGQGSARRRRDARGRRGLVGRRDFRGFTDDDPDEKSTIVEIGAVTIEEDGDAIIIVIEGSHFLWKLVRRLVGVLVEIGKGALRRPTSPRLLDEPKGLPATLTAPPSGLFLARVTYPGDPRGPIPRPPVALPAPRPSARRP